MYEWNEMVQRMVDWLEEHLTENPVLLKMSEQLGYSPYYCSRQFNQYTGMTLRDYVWTRRISRAALELRDTDQRVLDIAVKYGFSSQEAFTRAFHKAFGMTPAAYRKSPRPIPLSIRQEVFSPYHYWIKERKFHERSSGEAGGDQGGVHSGAQVHRNLGYRRRGLHELLEQRAFV